MKIILTILFCALAAGCSTENGSFPPGETSPPIKISTNSPTDILHGISPSSLIFPAVARTNCPSMVRNGNQITIFNTNCVELGTFTICTNCPNPAYGQFSFTAYVNSSSNVVMESGMALPADWIGYWVTNSDPGERHWTLQCIYNSGDPWTDGFTVTNHDTFCQFSESDAIQPQAFYRVKLQ